MFSGSVGLSGDVSDASEYHQDGSDDSDVHSIGCSYGGCRKSLVSSGIGQVGHVQSHEDDGYDGEEQCDYPEDLVDRFAAQLVYRFAAQLVDRFAAHLAAHSFRSKEFGGFSLRIRFFPRAISSRQTPIPTSKSSSISTSFSL